VLVVYAVSEAAVRVVRADCWLDAPGSLDETEEVGEGEC
jgi:hypothetical protein